MGNHQRFTGNLEIRKPARKEIGKGTAKISISKLISIFVFISYSFSQSSQFEFDFTIRGDSFVSYAIPPPSSIPQNVFFSRSRINFSRFPSQNRPTDRPIDFPLLLFFAKLSTNATSQTFISSNLEEAKFSSREGESGKRKFGGIEKMEEGRGGRSSGHLADGYVGYRVEVWPRIQLLLFSHSTHPLACK